MKPLAVGSMSSRRRLALLHMYEGSTKPLGHLKTALKTIQNPSHRSLCAYCGLGPADDWDHVLPKNQNQFPELSVCAFNLSPSCPTCNRVRGTRWTQTFHVYWDKISGQPRCLSVVLPGADLTDVSFELTPPHGVSPQFVARLDSHVGTLNLLSRWNEAAAGELYALQASKLRTSFKMGLSISDVQDAFAAEARGWEKVYSLNYWKAVLYDALSKDADCIREIGPW